MKYLGMHHPVEPIRNSPRLVVLQIPRLLFCGLRTLRHGAYSAVLREHAWDDDKKRSNTSATNRIINFFFFDTACGYAEGKRGTIKRSILQPGCRSLE